MSIQDIQKHLFNSAPSTAIELIECMSKDLPNDSSKRDVVLCDKG